MTKQLNSKPATRREIKRVARHIAEQFRPRKIILFGSHARGEASEDSDVDLLVLMETSQPPIHTAADIAASVEHPFPLDVVVMSPFHLEASIPTTGHFCGRSRERGGGAV